MLTTCVSAVPLRSDHTVGRTAGPAGRDQIVGRDAARCNGGCNVAFPSLDGGGNVAFPSQELGQDDKGPG